MVEVDIYFGLANRKGELYCVDNKPLFIVPREDSTFAYVNTLRKINNGKVEWSYNLAEPYTFEELNELLEEQQKSYLEFPFIFYVEDAEEYPLDETIIRTITKKYDQLLPYFIPS